MNLIMLTVDAMRKETLKCYNKEDGISTGFKEFYNRGSVFNNMYITIPETYQSLGTFFTGLYPFNHKVAMEPYDKSKLMLFDYLLDSHKMLLFTTEPPLGESLTYDEYKKYNLQLEGGGRVDLRKKIIDVSKICDFIEKNNNNDFFITSHIWRPRKYGINRNEEFRDLLKEKKYDEIWDGSLELINDAGVAIEKIFKQLEKSNLLDNTIVIVTSDHGDYFSCCKGDYHKRFYPNRKGYIEREGIKHTELHFEPVINVPFILYHPKIKNKEFNEFISFVDIMPTVMDFLGKEVKTSIDGKSHANFLLGKSDFIFRDIFVDRSVTGINYTIIDKNGWKLILSILGSSGSNIFLYNIIKDKAELNDLSEKEIEKVRELIYKLYNNYPIDFVIKKEDIMFRYLNYKNIDYVKKIFNDMDIDDWKTKAENYNKIRWIKDKKLLNIFYDNLYKDIPKESKILEIGIGTGELTKFVKEKNELSEMPASYIGIDSSPSMLSHVKDKDIEIITGDAHRLSFVDNSFDVVIMRGVLHYLENPQTVFNEIFRVLKSGGQFILCEEIAQSDDFFADWLYINRGAKEGVQKKDRTYFKTALYRKNDIINFLHNAGFKINNNEEILLEKYSLNNFLLIYEKTEKRTIKRRYHDANNQYKQFIDFKEEDDIRSGQPYGDIFVNINFLITKGVKEKMKGEK